METKTDSSTINQKPENTRAGGPDDTRDVQPRQPPRPEEPADATREATESTPSN